jgi:hypothetical protein
MVIPVQPKDSFDVEPGRYHATCTDVREKDIHNRTGTQKGLRIVWELAIPGTENTRHLVGKNYEATLTRNSLLRNDLVSWFGHDINVREFDTATLKGKEAIVTVQHIENEGWAKPYCWVARVEPATNEDQETVATMISPQNVVRG